MIPYPKHITIGTRGSQMALVQASRLSRLKLIIYSLVWHRMMVSYSILATEFCPRPMILN